MSITSVINKNLGDSSFVVAQKPNPPEITGYSVSDNDDTALDPAGGQTVLINGSGFQRGATITFDGIAVSAVTWISPNQLSFIAPAKNAGTYTLYVVNSDLGTAIYIPGVIYSTLPTWATNAGTLGNYYETTNISTSVIANGDAPITYTLYSGSLPDGAVLSSNGIITGTSPIDGSSTTYSFTVEAIDAQLQSSTRSFSLTINTDVVTWINPANEATLILDGVEYSNQLTAASAAGYTISNFSADTLPTGLTLSGNTISGTPTVEGITSTVLSATATTTGRSATNNITWIVSLSDAYWKNVTTLLSTASGTPFNSDASTNNFDITIVGDTKPSNFNPHSPGYYSNYFDGTGDYLSIADNTGFDYGTGNFTVEFWMYPAAAKACQIYDHANSPASGVAGLFVNFTANSTVTAGQSYGSTYVTSSAVTLNTWHHVAVVRNGTAWTIYINGNSSGTGSSAVNLTASGPITIGGNSRNTAESFQGYLSNLRVIKDTALYITKFTPSTTPLSVVSGTSLLTCQGSGIVDSSANKFSITRNGNTYVSSFVPYIPNVDYSNYGSAYFDGTGDYLSLSDNDAFDFGTGDFTMEMWVYVQNSAGTGLVEHRPPLYGSNPWLWYITATNRYLELFTGTSYTGNISIPLNSWTHIAISRSSGVLKQFVNGVQAYSGTVTTSLDSTHPLLLMRSNDSTQYLGYTSNIRIIKGTSIYSSAFTPPTSPLIAVSGTSLLTCQSNQPANNNTFLDISSNNFNITRVGNTTQGAFGPYGYNWSVHYNNRSYINSETTAGAYTSIPNSTKFDLGTGDFTLEGWIYPEQLPSADTWPTNWQNHSVLFGRGTPSTADGYDLVLGATKLIFQSNDVAVASGTHNIIVGNWYHVAVSRTSGTLRLFVNGTSIASISYTGTPGAGSNFYMGSETGQGAYFYGYMSNVRLVKGTGLYTTGFTPSTTPLLPVAGTQVLTNQSQSFIDMSANKGVVTATNSPSIQKLSPFGNITASTLYYSGYFDGSGDYLTVPNTNSIFSFGTGDFTVEAWICLNTLPSSGGYPGSYWIVGGGPSNSGTGFDILITPTNLQVGLADFNSLNINYPHGMSTDTWYHVAVVREGNTLSAYKNGILLTSSNVSGITADPMLTGMAISAAEPSGANAGNLNGHISNLRVVKGTAVYTSNFVPSTNPLTNIAGTSLLTCQSDTFIDNSTNAITVTVNGNSKPSTVNPFGITYSSKQTYTKSIFGSSMYFDGAGDYLSSSNSAFAMGTGSFTWEAWIYWTGNSTGYRQIFSTRTAATGSTTAGSLALVANTNALTWYTNAATSTSVTVPINSWAHVAIVRNGTALTIYLNGVSAATATNSDNLTASIFSIGANNDGSEPFMGYISDVKVTKGQAVYTSNFMPSNTPMTATKNSIYLVNGTGTGIFDSSQSVALETVGDTKLNTSIVKFSKLTSVYFDGSGDYLLTNPTPNLEFGAGDFTIEFWFYRVGTGRMALYNGSWGTDFSIGIDFSSIGTNTLGIWASSTGTGWNLINADAGGNGIGTIVIPQNTWTHIAFVRKGNTWKSFVNGVPDISISGVSGSIVSRASASKAIGAWYSTGAMTTANGYISDFRITKGIARYDSAFSVPIIPFKAK